MIVFKKKEKKVLELIEAYMDTVEECLTQAVAAIRAYLGGNAEELDQYWKQVDALESRADQLLHEVRDHLFSGAYLPLVREDIHRLLEEMDRVVNAAEDGCKFFINQRPAVPEALSEKFGAILDESFGVGKPMKKAVKSYFKKKGDLEDVRRHAKEVASIESRVDDFEWDLTTTIFASAELELSQKLHLKQALNRIVEVSDRAEDACDQLELAALKLIV